MAAPKRKTSRSYVKMRVRSHKKKIPSAHTCANCGAAQQPHRVCPSCGYYNGRQVLSISADD